MTPKQMAAFAAEHGLAALLDHLGLDGLGNEVDGLRAEVERLTDDVKFHAATVAEVVSQANEALADANADADQLAALLAKTIHKTEGYTGPDVWWAEEARAALRQHEARVG